MTAEVGVFSGIGARRQLVIFDLTRIREHTFPYQFIMLGHVEYAGRVLANVEMKSGWSLAVM